MGVIKEKAKTPLLFVLFLSLPLHLFSQAGEREVVALLPLWGENESVTRQFGEELFNAMNAMDGYRAFLVDMVNLPEGVPAGGFPPFIAPSPLLTRDAAFALTGDVSLNAQTGMQHMRLFLWRMEDARLLFSDEAAGFDRFGIRVIIPFILEWLFSHAVEAAPAEIVRIVYVEAEPVEIITVVYVEAEPVEIITTVYVEAEPVIQLVEGPERIVFVSPDFSENWLYVGGRVGVPVFIHGFPRWDNADDRFVGSHFFPTMNWAFSIKFQPLFAVIQPFSEEGIQFGIQFEVGGVHDWETGIHSFTLPAALLRASQRRGSALFTLFGGGYYTLPAGNVIFHHPNRGGGTFGWTAGFAFGNKVGPGHIVLDIRFARDFSDTIRNDLFGAGFRRNLLSISVGYEFGFIRGEQ